MSVFALWLPVLVAAVAVFFTSSLIHMLIKWHNADYRPLANEDEVREAIRRGAPTPGQYVIPYCKDHKDLAAPEMQKRFVDGPVGILMLRTSGQPQMGPLLGRWFGLNLFVAVIAALVGGATLLPGDNGHRVFHVVALVTFAAYACGALSDAIWKGYPGKAAMKDVADALAYGVVSGLVFAALWPSA